VPHVAPAMAAIGNEMECHATANAAGLGPRHFSREVSKLHGECTASLRQELAEHADIHVCGVFPIVDTPGFLHGANMSGRRLDPGMYFTSRPATRAWA
jgi:hypothetical protein